MEKDVYHYKSIRLFATAQRNGVKGIRIRERLKLTPNQFSEVLKTWNWTVNQIITLKDLLHLSYDQVKYLFFEIPEEDTLTLNGVPFSMLPTDTTETIRLDDGTLVEKRTEISFKIIEDEEEDDDDEKD